MTPQPRDAAEGRRAIFSAPAGTSRPVASPEVTSRGEGRRALFSAAPTPEEPQAADAPRPGGTLVVACSACGARTPVRLLELWRLLVPSLWLPFRRHPQLLRCPSCRRMAWCRITPRR